VADLTPWQKARLAPSNEPGGIPTAYRRPPSVTMVGVVIVAVLFLLAFVPGPGPFETDNPPASILRQIWKWLDDNRNSIAPLSQLLTSAGVLVAALTFYRTQRLNRSEFLYKVVKEVSDKSVTIRETGYTSKVILDIIRFYSTLFPYYYYRLVGDQEWGLIEKDLSQFVQKEEILWNWLDPRGRRPKGFPPVGQFDEKFIAYLRDLQSRPSSQGNK